MQTRTTLARPYARAAFDVARSRDMMGTWSEALGLAAAIAADDSVAELIDNPRLDRDQIVALFADIGQERFDDAFGNFLRALAENRRFELLPEIHAQFETLRRETEQRIQVHVTSARPVSDDQASRLGESLRKRYGRDVDLEVEIDEALIGGAIIRAGDEVIDGSVRGRLERLGRQIAS